jgi:hypothetical protein
MSERIARPPRTADPDEMLEWLDEVHRHLVLVGSEAVNVGNITAGTIQTFTINVTGAKPDEGMSVALAPPSAIEAGLMWSAFVSADDLVTVRLMAHTTGDVNPGLTTWSCRVFR